MGKYLQRQYEERDLAKTLVKFHGIIDEETKKLSDKVKNLTLSHNRMRELLKMCLRYLEVEHHNSLFFGVPCGLDDKDILHKRITLELYGLENYKGLKD